MSSARMRLLVTRGIDHILPSDGSHAVRWSFTDITLCLAACRFEVHDARLFGNSRRCKLELLL
ncbi:MAG: hypothetical protein BYD32DRAFT_410486 [Podila humilis]|nr:MAG: hypothetical protein BYD32DRAFT_410486 [Podila humilis]